MAGIETLGTEVLDLNIANIRSKHLDKLVSMKVMVSKVGTVQSEHYANIYKCPDCRISEELPLSESNPRCSCGRVFVLANKLERDFKEIEVEEILDDLNRQPVSIRCKLVGSLLETKKVEYLAPGDSIDIVGFVKLEKVKRSLDRAISTFTLLIERLDKYDEEEELKLTEEDINKIKEISKKEPLEKLSNSLAPHIIGNEDIKTSIILQMVRGSSKLNNTRPLIHILIVGDASTSKSQLVQSAHNKSPRSIYGSGESMSKTGLAMTFEKDDLTGKWGVRSGSLSRAHKSTMMIDEFDKLSSEDKKVLHTAMESGFIVADKVGIHVELPSSTSILAACNPKKGKIITNHFDSIQSQIDLSPPLMSRFDLIFIVKDEVDLERDTKIMTSLLSETESKGPLSATMFKKYIKYATRLEPALTKESKEYAIQLATKLRQTYVKQEKDKSMDSPFSFRQAGGLIRLACASAKVRLSETVDVEDFQIAERLILNSLKTLGFGNGLGSIEYNALFGGVTKKKQNLMDNIKTLLKQEIANGNRDEDKIKGIILEYDVSKNDLEKAWYQLRNEGSIIGSRNHITYME